MEYQEQIEYQHIIETLINTFGEVLSRDVLYNIVENYEGDLEGSANAIINIVMDENNAAVTNAQPDISVNVFEQEVAEVNQIETYNIGSETNNKTVSEVAECLPALSYASASRSTKPPEHQAGKRPSTSDMAQNFWTEQLQKILLHHEKGARILIIMRGLPGSGKTYLAEKIIDAIYYTRHQHYHTHILSTDDYFMRNGVYMYDKSRIPEAHEWNHSRANKAMTEGLSPVIIDNTNIEIWEMEYYVVQGVKNGYIIEVLEPNTPWARNVNQLFKKNSHNVPVVSIRRKLENFQSGISGEYLIKQFMLHYSSSNKPPVLRTIPPVSLKLTEESVSSNYHTENASNSNKNSPMMEIEKTHHENTQSCSTELEVQKRHHENVQSCLTEPEVQKSHHENVQSCLTEPGVQKSYHENIQTCLTEPEVDPEVQKSYHETVQSCLTEPEVQKSYHETVQSCLTEPEVDPEVQKSYHETVQSCLTEPEVQKSYHETVQSCLTEPEVQKSHHENVQSCLTEPEVQKSDHENLQSFAKEPTTAAPNTEDPSDTVDCSKTHLALNLDKFAEIQKCLEEMEKVEKEWDNGDNWDDNSQNKSQESGKSNSVNSKPQRRNKINRYDTKEQFLTTDEVCQDWSRYSMFLPSWGESSTQVESYVPVVEKKTSSTCIEYGDTDITTSRNPLKIITSVPRNINEYHIAANDKKIPKTWMLDKSTSTHNNQILTDNFRCQNEEQHFVAFRKLFKNISRSDLRDIFDNCCGDVNWAVEIVLDGVASNQLNIVDSCDYSDTEAEEQNDNVDLCQCLSAYDVIPDHKDSSSPPLKEEIENSIINAPSSSRSKGKKSTFVSESSMQLKRQIEQNVVISDNHYSEHCLKIRKLRRGEYYMDYDYSEKPNVEQTNTEISETHSTEINAASTSQNFQSSSSHSSTPSTSKIENVNTESYDEDSPIYEDVEKTVNVNLGKEFISQLDKMFGRHDMEYPSSVIPKINMPISLLNEINALWMESLMNQLEEDAKQSQIMLQQDEDFARQLAIKEAELIQSGKEPEVPDLKEIMDMDFALSLYHKDVAEWRNTMPVDLAAKLTMDKLFNTFPDIPQDFLSEVYMAHDYNFQVTVEVLLISTGQSEVLETKNGISKFVMEKEMERQQKLLEEEKKTISEVEWPLLPKTEQLDMSVVQRYRDEAEKHLQARNKNYQKAEEYIRRGMTQAATYYSGNAAYHKEKYELANSMAAATLMQVHAANASDNATIDLHYLRVGEARESVDLFIDTHIQKLREVQDRNSVKFHTLYFITGRGLHSNGGPRIKPAVKKRLAERGLVFSERNPGLLTTRVSADDKLSHQVA